MKNYVELSRVGCEVEDCLDADIPAECFKSIGKIWRPLHPLCSRTEELIYLVELCEARKTRFRVTEQTLDLDEKKSRKYLVIGYENDFIPTPWRQGEESEFLVQYLLFLFNGYNKELDVNTMTMMHRTINLSDKINTQELSINNLAKRFYDVLYDQHEHSCNLETDKIAPLQVNIRFQPKLCRYQDLTVRWLLKREQEVVRFHAHFLRLSTVVDGSFRYKHQLSSRIESAEPTVTEIPPGGILADEMGLGKTVEMLALILLHPREKITPFALSPPPMPVEEPAAKKSKQRSIVFCICISKLAYNMTQCSRCLLWQHKACVERYNADHDESINQPYVCPACWNELTRTTLLCTGATIIVTPNAIRSQWLAEIRRHTAPELRTLVYEGVNSWISPRQLAAYDVVLTDYAVLRSEVHHTSAQNSGRTMRSPPRLMRTYTPLLTLEWWRVCLDEAQIVESNTSKVTELVRLLPAINRWAVTGTPIQRSLDDLRPLLTFIGLQSLCDPPQTWDALVKNFSLSQDKQRYALTELMHRFMWRSCKSRVAEELPIPPQTELVHYVEQSNLEKLFYTEQHAKCASIFAKTVEKYIERAGGTLHISPNVMNSLMAPLSKIRQCCTISVVKRGPKGNNGGLSHNQFLQPKELHYHLKTITESECKSELRSMALSYNGMAGIYFLQENFQEAVRQYLNLLELASAYKNVNLSVDSLLQIHALHNIVEAFEAMPASDREDLLDERLNAYKVQCSALRWKYLEPYASNLEKVQSAFKASAAEYNHICERTSDELLDFVCIIVSKLSKTESSSPTFQRIHDALAKNFPSNQIVLEMQTFSSYTYVISSWHNKVKEMLDMLRKVFDKLKFFSDNVRPDAQIDASSWAEMKQFITRVYDCHLSELRKKTKNEPKKTVDGRRRGRKLCDLCIVKDMLNEFECLLFNKAIAKHTKQAEGVENPSMQFLLLKLIFNSTKWNGTNSLFGTEISKHLKSIECMQTMAKKWMALWIEIEFAVKAYDELDMCKMRLSLQTNSDYDEDECIYRVDPLEMEMLLLEQITRRQDAEREFITKLARLKYIIYLEANSNTEPCPICHSDEELRYAVLECGHFVCVQCLKQMRRLGIRQQITCAICRHKQCSTKVFYVERTSTPLRKEVEGIEIAGNYSAKITYIVRLIVKLKHECSQSGEKEGPKILIFSQWQEILGAIAEALAENGVRHLLRSTPRDIANFKDPELRITCLLMPISKGAKGLNLTEATHVFLIEPLLNPGDDKQAIGRVHRFGQTKPTTVHRFVVRGTIEEKIYNILVASDTTNLCLNNTKSLEYLRNLFHLQDQIVEVEDIEVPPDLEV